MNKINVLVVNINNLNYTKNCISDLLKQTNKNFNITLIDQGSTENGTTKYLNSLSKNSRIKIIKNDTNVSLNKLWNDFYLNNKEDYLCYLNNDVRLTDNFIQDTIDILDKDDKVGIVVHSTNSFKYNDKNDELNYVIPKEKIKQGWDFTIRKSVYKIIPNELLFYFGDDWLFHHCYQQKYNVAICLSSPIIHYAEKSAKYSPVNFKQEEVFFNNLGLKRYLPHYNDYSEILPSFKKFGEKPPKTIIYLGIKYNEIKNTYTDNDKIVEINKLILNDIRNNKLVTQSTKDIIKLRVSRIINDALNNNYDTWCIYDINLLYTLKYYLPHLPNIKFIVDIEFNDDVINYIINRYNLSEEKSIEFISKYKDDIVKYLTNINFSF